MMRNWQGTTQESSTASTVSPCKCPHTDQVIEVPETDQGICAARGKVVASGVKLNADAVGWVGVQHMLKLQVRITERKKKTSKKEEVQLLLRTREEKHAM